MLFQDKNRTPRERAEDLLSRLTLREKVGQLNQRLYGFSSYERKGEEILLSQELQDEVERWGGLGVLYGLYRADPWSQKDFRNGLYGVYAKRAYNQVQRYVMEHSRFGIPVLMSSECPHGHQALDGYLLPVNLGVGAAWNPDLTREAYGVCGKQLKELGVHYSLMSMLDVLRDPPLGPERRVLRRGPGALRQAGQGRGGGLPGGGGPGGGQALLRPGGDHRGRQRQRRPDRGAGAAGDPPAPHAGLLRRRGAGRHGGVQRD